MEKILDQDPEEDPFDKLISQAQWQANELKNGTFFDFKNQQEEQLKSRPLLSGPIKPSVQSAASNLPPPGAAAVKALGLPPPPPVPPLGPPGHVRDISPPPNRSPRPNASPRPSPRPNELSRDTSPTDTDRPDRAPRDRPSLPPPTAVPPMFESPPKPPSNTPAAALSPEPSPSSATPTPAAVEPSQPSIREEHKKHPAAVQAAMKDPNICFTCLKRVQPQPGEADSLLKAINRLWHKTCWCCCECRKSLVGRRFGADGPYIYCEWDYKRKFFCSVCGNPILDKIITDKSGLLYHRQCFTQRNVGEDADFRKWMDEFNEATSRPKPAASASTSSAPASAPIPTPAHSQAAASTIRPSSPPSASPPAVALALGQVTIEILTAQMRELGNPPNPKENPAAYKIYMQKKFAIESQANAILLRQPQQNVATVKDLLSPQSKDRNSDQSSPAVLEARSQALLQQIRDFGRPPHPQENPLAYKDFMLRKYQLEERINATILQLNQAAPPLTSLAKQLAAAMKDLGKPPASVPAPAPVTSSTDPLSARSVGAVATSPTPSSVLSARSSASRDSSLDVLESRTTSLLQSMRALGPPPSYSDPIVYKEYMQRKYQLEESANSLLVQLQQHSDAATLGRDISTALKHLGKDTPVPDARTPSASGPGVEARVNSLVYQLRELGKPPNAAEDLQAYKDYMHKKYQLEEQANALLLQVKAIPDLQNLLLTAMREVSKGRPSSAISPPLSPKSGKK